ncbi:hypothetical protein ABT297_37565 [Dactylosporangium sp. NPDC000555]|uniref:hypothetical protein n=1 Tax=Dactylosporangium sp. NPDC000555 TaxID=3154260 RepID=UPI0033339EB4
MRRNMLIGGLLIALSCVACGWLGYLANVERPTGAPDDDALTGGLLVTAFVLVGAGRAHIGWAWTGRRR